MCLAAKSVCLAASDLMILDQSHSQSHSWPYTTVRVVLFERL